jgi:uncharacterized protein YozE (UPF0346 family)
MIPATLGLGGYTIVFAVAFILLVLIAGTIVVFRQIQRVRLNSARREINSSIAPETSKKHREGIISKINAVAAFRQSYFPKFTDCNMISEHATKSYVQRMIGFDEINRSVDRQLEFINPHIVRSPGQSTYSFLKELREMANLTELDDHFIERLSFLHEACRFRTVCPFGETELEELRRILKEFLKILANNQAHLSSISPLTSKAQNNGSDRRPSGGITLRRGIRSQKGTKMVEEIPLLHVGGIVDKGKT